MYANEITIFSYLFLDFTCVPFGPLITYVILLVLRTTTSKETLVSPFSFFRPDTPLIVGEFTFAWVT